MEIKIEIEDLRKRKIFVATPMYGGMCSGMFCRSTNDLSALAMHYCIELKYYYLFNESLITRARNYCCDEFMRSDCTHMLFIDADIGFEANDVISMMALMDDTADDGKDIMCSPYPKKCIAWEKIKAAVDQGQADEDANKLDNFVGDYVFNPVPGTTEISLDEPAEVLEGGTGFMMFTKKTLQTFKDAYWDESPDSPGGFSYKPDHVRTEHFDGSREIMMYFQALIDPETRRYLSEDYMFCQWARKAGLKIWLCPWIHLSHVGSFVYGGSLQALAAIGASATADNSLLGKKQGSPISELEKKQQKVDSANKRIRNKSKRANKRKR